MVDPEKTLYHQLELMNMMASNKVLPSFVRAVPSQELRFFLNETRHVLNEIEVNKLWSQ
jgi:hypothetical protein